MLYERWKHISAGRRREIALRDHASGRRWTFGELADAGEKEPSAAAPVACPQGHSPGFILQLLAAWREQKIVCPLEPGQDAPPLLAGRLQHVPASVVHLKCTSATSGDAKLVAFTAAQLMADADNIVATMGLRPDWPNLGVISLAHSYGFSNLVLPLLLHGIPLVLGPAPLPEIVRQIAGPEPAATLPAVPAMWRVWHQANAIPANVRLAISAGAPLPLKLEQDIFAATGVKVHNFLGASECGGIAFDRSAVPRTDAALAGTAMDNVRLSLNDDGCLTVRSDAVAETYWPDRSPDLGRGVFQTSDLADLEGGSVFLRGRLGDVINIAGRKISPESIERILQLCPGVRECLVFGAPSHDAERSEIAVAVIVGDAKEPVLKAFLLEKLPAWQVPRRWHFVDSLSTNTRGKISRAEWRKRFSDV